MIPNSVKAILDANGLTALEFEQGSTPTSVLAAQKIGCTVGQIAKSILVKTKADKFFLIVCAGDLRIDNKKLKDLIGAKARMATGEETEQQTGFKPGAVCPFGISNTEIYIDRSLKQYNTIYPAAGTDAGGVPVAFNQLLSIVDGTVCDVMKS